MVNLEELCLSFLNCTALIIDGNILTSYFLRQIPRLYKLTFNIGSMINLNYLRHLPSNEDIKKTFENFQNNQII
jgi:hypothetical protein